MPVEFECPHCRETLRKADAAMGGPSDCDACGRPYRVPTVAVPREAVAETAVFDRAALAKQLGADEPFDPDAFGQPTPTAARAPYRRRKKSKVVPIAATVVALAAVGAAAYAMTLRVGPLRGSLTARPAEASGLTAVVDLPEGPGREATLRTLERGPAGGTVSAVEVTLSRDEDRVRVTAAPGDGTKLIAVDFRQDANAAKWVAGNAATLARRRDAALGEATAELSAGDGGVTGLQRFAAGRATLALVRGLGAFVLAGSGGVGYPAVGEPEVGVLVFAVPAGTRSLELLPAAGVGDVLPREFGYSVTVE